MKIQRVITIHEYQLKKGITDEQFEHVVKKARERDLFCLPGLMQYHFLKRIRGTRKVDYTAIWVYKDLETWEKVWGKAENPITKEFYPEKWKIWEDELLAPILTQEPDHIYYAAYEEF